MNPGYVWLSMVGMGLVTFAARYSVIGLLGGRELPQIVQRGLRFVPPAVLTAIIVPAVLMPDGTLDASLGNVRLLAALIAVGVAWFSKRTLLTIAAGMIALWALQYLLT